MESSVYREAWEHEIRQKHPDWEDNKVEWMVGRIEYWSDFERRGRLFAAHLSSAEGQANG